MPQIDLISWQQYLTISTTWSKGDIQIALKMNFYNNQNFLIWCQASNHSSYRLVWNFLFELVYSQNATLVYNRLSLWRVALSHKQTLTDSLTCCNLSFHLCTCIYLLLIFIPWFGISSICSLLSQRYSNSKHRLSLTLQIDLIVVNYIAYNSTFYTLPIHIKYLSYVYVNKSASKNYIS